MFLVQTSKCAASADAVSSVSVTGEWVNRMCSLFVTFILWTSDNVKHEHAGNLNFAADDSLQVFAHPCIKNFLVLNDKFIQSHCWQVLMIHESHKQMCTLQWMCLGGMKINVGMSFSISHCFQSDCLDGDPIFFQTCLVFQTLDHLLSIDLLHQCSDCAHC